MQTLKKAIPTTAGRTAILNVILNPNRLPEWSLFIKAVRPKKAGYVAQTLNGLVEREDRALHTGATVPLSDFREAHKTFMP